MIQKQHIAKTTLSGFEIKLASTSREEDRGGRGRYQNIVKDTLEMHNMLMRFLLDGLLDKKLHNKKFPFLYH